MKEIIKTDDAPQAIGTYSQAVATTGKLVFLSGQIPLTPEGVLLSDASIEAQIHQVFKNLRAVALASGGSLDNVVKLNVFLTDMNHFAAVNTVMAEYFTEPYPARAAVGVAQLPKDAPVEMEAILSLP